MSFVCEEWMGAHYLGCTWLGLRGFWNLDGGACHVTRVYVTHLCTVCVALRGLFIAMHPRITLLSVLPCVV